MTKAILYFKDHLAEDGSIWGEIRVSIVNRFDNVIKDVSYDEFKKMRGYHQIRLHNLKPITAIGL